MRWLWPFVRGLVAAALPMACSGVDGPVFGLERRPPNTTCHPPLTPVPSGLAGLPARLAETGCFDPADPARPLPALIPYGVNASLWSDGAEKERWLALPDGGRIHIKADGDWELPPGAVLIKTFRLGGRPIETRFLVRHLGGEWSGYTYGWNEAGTDATLLADGSHRRGVGDAEWHYPSRGECRECHTAAAGYSLGLETAQLDRTFDYPGGRRANQLTTLARLGLFADPLPAGAEGGSALPRPDDARAPLEARARAYLHANCAHCHRPEVDNSGSVDLRFGTRLAATMSCDAKPLKGSLGYGAHMRIIAPGKPEASMVVLRMNILESGRMPTVASLAIDHAGVALLSDWIRSIVRCP
jgi:uncharacterized repeat protein (TIGR03806 family)